MKDVIALLALAVVVYLIATRAGLVLQNAPSPAMDPSAPTVMAWHRSASTEWVEPTRL